MPLNKHNKIILVIILIVASFILGDIWGSHRLPFQDQALQSSANEGIPSGGTAKIGAKAPEPNWKVICNSGTWWLHSECYGGRY